MYVCHWRQVHRTWQESQWLNLNSSICMCYAEALQTCLVQWNSVNHMQFAEITRWWLDSGRDGTAEFVHHSNVECNLLGYQSIDIIRLESKPLEMISVKWSAKIYKIHNRGEMKWKRFFVRHNFLPRKEKNENRKSCEE